MCNFLSAIAYQNGDLFAAPEYTDSHEDLIQHLGLQDKSKELRNWCRVEFRPGESLIDPDSYTLTVDDLVPQWWEEIKDRVQSKLADRIRRMVVASPRDCLLGGCWIIGEGIAVKWVKGARVYAMLKDSQVGELRGNSQVGVLWGNSRVGVLWENSQVGELRGNSQVGVLWGNSRVGELRENSRVGVDHRSKPAEAEAKQ